MTIGREFDRNYCLSLEKSLDHEWLETNGLGAYASSTILDCHTRKYHGLYVSPLAGLPGKYVLLSKLETVIKGTDKVNFSLSTNKFPKVFHPTGHKYIESVSHKLFPTTRWKVADALLERSLLWVHQTNHLILRYELKEAPSAITLHFLPWLAFRDSHHLSSENLHLQVKMYPDNHGSFKFHPYSGMPALYITAQQPAHGYPGPAWVKSLEYLEERTRGYPYQEDLFCPGVLEKSLKKGEVFYLVVGLQPCEEKAEDLWNKEVSRRKNNLNQYKESYPSLQYLKYKSTDYLVKNLRGHLSITAGYPWFGEWGRDALISLPGLCLYTGKTEEAISILKGFAQFEKNGLLPNMLGNQEGEDSYNCIDAPLWYFWAIHHTLTKDPKSKKIIQSELLPTLKSIVDSYRKGIPGYSGCDANGLIGTGNETTQLTWMDANAYGKPVTSRHGYAVELNSLWILALGTLIDLLDKKDPAYTKSLKELLKSAQVNFFKEFWSESYGYFADCINNNGKDLSVRPNQLLALTNPYIKLSPEQVQSCLAVITHELVTPQGLRSLSPKHPKYVGQYQGDQNTRDSAYHQGTVWAWWVGLYVEASLLASGKKSATAQEMLEIFNPLFITHCHEYGLGGVSEIFDGNPPFSPRGCPFQAWSVAECIRAFELIKENLL